MYDFTALKFAEICLLTRHWYFSKCSVCAWKKCLFYSIHVHSINFIYYMQIFYLFLTFFLICQLLVKVCFTISNEKCLITVNIFISPYNFMSKMYDFLSFFFQAYWGKVVYIILQFPWVQMAKLRSTFILIHKNRIACDHNKPMWC